MGAWYCHTRPEKNGWQEKETTKNDYGNRLNCQS